MEYHPAGSVAHAAGGEPWTSVAVDVGMQRRDLFGSTSARSSTEASSRRTYALAVTLYRLSSATRSTRMRWAPQVRWMSLRLVPFRSDVVDRGQEPLHAGVNDLSGRHPGPAAGPRQRRTPLWGGALAGASNPALPRSGIASTSEPSSGFVRCSSAVRVQAVSHAQQRRLRLAELYSRVERSEGQRLHNVAAGGIGSAERRAILGERVIKMSDRTLQPRQSTRC